MSGTDLAHVETTRAGARMIVRVNNPSSITDDQIADSYRRFQTVKAAGAELGISGQYVHARMKRAGIPTNKIDIFTDEERVRIRKYYENTAEDIFDAEALAKDMGRSSVGVSRVARQFGLTRKGRPHNSEARGRQAATMREKWKRQPHPRGATGIKFSDDALAKMSEASKKTWALSKTFGIIHMSPEARSARSLASAKRMAARDASKSHTRAAGGKREDIGDTWFRSSWEANYARYLNLLVKMKLVDSWEFEPETFWFSGVKRGTVSYLPDFKVMYRNDPKPEYVEIKGWVTAKDRTKWKRMAKYHPQIKLVVLAKKEYRDLENKWRSAIPEWESGLKKKRAYTLILGKEAPL